MRILVSVNHPAHVHLFKHFIWEMEKQNHDIDIVARDKEITRYLLDIYGFDYVVISKKIENTLGITLESITRLKNLLSISHNVYPDITLSITDGTIGMFSRILNIPSVQLTDTEHAKLILKTAMPFADIVLTPMPFLINLGAKQIRYNGYHELAYLHPNYFKPDPSVLDQIGLDHKEQIILLRFISWTASHDIGQKGISKKISFVKELEKYGTVLITSEGRLNPQLEKYQVRIPPEKMHDLLYYADIYIGEGATMATEAALLGTPAIYVSTLSTSLGNFIELEKKYGLVFNYTTPTSALEKAKELLENHAQYEWKKKRKRLIRDKIDLTAFMVWFIENYPDSIEEFKENPAIQYQFASKM